MAVTEESDCDRRKAVIFCRAMVKWLTIPGIESASVLIAPDPSNLSGVGGAGLQQKGQAGPDI